MNRLFSDKSSVVAAVRLKPIKWLTHFPVVEVGDLDANTDWSVALTGVTSVVHTAARVHVMKDQTADPLAEFRRVNVAGTLNLARQASAAGVKRLVFVSSVKVNGEQTQIGQPFTEKDVALPLDPYGISKYEAEEGLRRIAKETGMEVVIIRPVLVYGPGVKGNFLSMMRWLHKGIPLPFGAINNARSVVALDNLVDFIITCMHHPAAANQTFLVSDEVGISTTQLLQYTASAMGVKSRLIPVPALMIQVSAKLLGKGEVAQRLCGNLQVDISKARKLLGWVPPISVKEGLRNTVESYVQSGSVLK
ncbi:WcaG Nucleoside-diphosphate-sugar epimerases [Methylophilaceae bacterium]